MTKKFKVEVRHSRGYYPSEVYTVSVSDKEELRPYFKRGIAKQKAMTKYAKKYNVMIMGKPAMANMKAVIID